MEFFGRSSLFSEGVVVRQSFLKCRFKWLISWNAESSHVFGVALALKRILSYVTISESECLSLELLLCWFFSCSEGIRVSTTFSVAKSNGLITAFLIRDKAGINF